MERLTAALRRTRDAASTPLVAGEAVNRAGRFLLLLLLAREVGAGPFGGWVLAIATATVLANAADAGLIVAGTTQIAAGRASARKYLANAWTAAPVLALASFAVLLALAPALGGMPARLLLLVGMGGALESTALLFLAPLRARERFAPEGLMRAAQGCLLLIAGGAIVVTAGAGETALGTLFLTVAVASVIFAAATAVRAFGFARPEIDLSFLRSLAAPALPAFGTTLVFFLYFRVDAYLLSAIKGAEATGLYGAAYNVAFGASFLPLLFGRAMLARFAAATAARELRAAFARAAKVTAGMAIALSLVLLLAAPLFLALYGDSFSAARGPYLLLVAAQAIFFFSHLNDMLLFGTRRGGVAWTLRAGALGFNIAANLALIPALGPAGAALAMIASEGALLGVQAFVIRPLLRGGWGAPRRAHIEAEEAAAA
jgi:O-antigen/teichoic acid export membrane protein